MIEQAKDFYEYSGRQYSEHIIPPDTALTKYFWFRYMEIIENYTGTGQSALYLGCVPPYYAKILTGRFSHVIGIDIAKTRLDQIELKENFFRVQADAERLPFRHGSFDFVLCNEFIEHFPEPETLIRNICRMLPTHGKVLIITVNRTEVRRILFSWLIRLGTFLTKMNSIEIRIMILKLYMRISGHKGRPKKWVLENQFKMRRHFFLSAGELKQLMEKEGFRTEQIEHAIIVPLIAYPFEAFPLLVSGLRWLEKNMSSTLIGPLITQNIVALCCRATASSSDQGPMQGVQRHPTALGDREATGITITNSKWSNDIGENNNCL